MNTGLHMTKRRKWSWTSHRVDQANDVIGVVNDLEEWWPLTLRQIYYRLVAAGKIENTRSRYNDLSKLIKYMRIDDHLPWEVMTDRTRRVSQKRGWTDSSDFVDAETSNFLEGYDRCYVSDQQNYVELWCEKDALSAIFERVAWSYCIRAVTCKGYDSITFLHDFRQRARGALSRGQTPVILYFGDMDPSGWQMLEATAQTLKEEFHLTGVEYRRIALNEQQVLDFGLPANPDAIKTTDTRYRSYVRRFGDLAVELDALHPATLEQMAEGAIRSCFDMAAFSEQMKIEKMERARLAEIKRRVVEEMKCMTSHTGRAEEA